MMKKKLRKLAEDIFNLAYVPIWGSEDKELRVQQYEQILKDVEKSGRQKEKQWWREKWQKRNKDIIQHIEQQCKPVPQLDAEFNSLLPNSWKHFVLRYNDGRDCTFETWVDSSEILSLHINDVNIPLEPMQPQFDADMVKAWIEEISNQSRILGYFEHKLEFGLAQKYQDRVDYFIRYLPKELHIE